jgi:hypothetical protein
MAALFTYSFIYLGFLGLAIGLYFTFRAIKLI